MWLHYPRPLLLLLLTSLLIRFLPSSANTEIINLAPSLNPRVPALDSISSTWPVLTPMDGQNERQWTMTHVPQEGDTKGCIGKREWCEDDLWLVLGFDADEWNGYRGFTLRISWPASVRPSGLYVRPASWVELLRTATFSYASETDFYMLQRARCSIRLISSWRHTHRKITLSKPAITRHVLLTSCPPTLKVETCTLGSDQSTSAS